MLKTLSISCQYLVNVVSSIEANCQSCQKLISFKQVFDNIFDKQRLLSRKAKLLILPSKNSKLTPSTITTIILNILFYSRNIYCSAKNRLLKGMFSKKETATTINFLYFFNLIHSFFT